MNGMGSRILAFVGFALAVSAAAAQPSPTRIRGTVAAVNGADVEIRTREGADVTVRLADTARVAAVAKASLADVKAGTFVGIAAVPRPDGTQTAIEVLIFPEAMRGAGEGHRPWDLLPESTMTNATVAETVARTEGRTLTLSYKDGQKTIVVPPEAPIVTLAPAGRADVRPGVKVFTVAGRPGPEGAFSAASITVGKDGVDPPM